MNERERERERERGGGEGGEDKEIEGNYYYITHQEAIEWKEKTFAKYHHNVAES